MDQLILTGFPMPPSANRLHLNRSGPGRGRFKSPEYREFERDVALWAIRNRRMISDAADFAAALDLDQGLHIDYAFCFPKTRLVAKAGHLKRLDVDNRIKACSDALARVLAFDDSKIVSGSFEKVALSEKAIQEFVALRLSKTHVSPIASFLAPFCS